MIGATHSLANFGIEGHKRLIDLVWLWFGSPHNEPSGNNGADF
jgi:hypothetical protein